MSLRFDHVIINVKDLNQAVKDFENMGFTVTYGGEHASGTTHNAIIPFKDGSYLELMARTGKPANNSANGMDFAPLLSNDEGFVGYALQSESLETEVTGLKERGLTLSKVEKGQRKRRDGIDLRWKLAVHYADYGPLIFIQDETPRNLRVPTDESYVNHNNGALGIKTILHVTDDVDAFREHMRTVLDLSPTEAYSGNTFNVQSVRINVTSPSTEVLRKHYEAHGNTVWRVVLRGVGEMYRHLNKDKLHGSDLIIIGEVPSS